MFCKRIEFQLWRPHKKSRMELIKARFVAVVSEVRDIPGRF